jgi:hypothetical protein
LTGATRGSGTDGERLRWQLALYLKYGLFPANVDTSDNSLVDNTNAGLAASLSGSYR